MPRPLRWRIGASLALACILGLQWLGALEGSTPSPVAVAQGGKYAQHQGRPSATLVAVAEGRHLVPRPIGAPSAHASALVRLANGDVLALWWAGQSESAADVAVYAARLHDEQWSEARRVVDRGPLGEALGFAVRRLGNPSAWVDRDGNVHLFVVATGLGGWAASRVVQLVSHDQGTSFQPVRVLALSPLFNTSVLTRTAPLPLDDGGALLPLYFELGAKYGIVVSLDAQGAPRWLRRIGHSTTQLQPTLIATSGLELHAYLRDVSSSRRVQHAVSGDAGLNWQPLAPLDLPNFDNSVAALALPDGSYVMAYHPEALQGGTSRQRLRLSRSTDAVQWTPWIDVEQGQPREEYSYPSLLLDGDTLHLSYTYRREAIAHQVWRLVCSPSATAAAPSTGPKAP